MTKFSIVVPAYNAQATLPETMDAILAQTFDDWECVVVDDGSNDSTLEIAQAYSTSDPRVHVVSQRNQGTAGAYNTGVKAAGSGLIVMCSADDLLLPEHLVEMAKAVDCGTACDIWSSNGYFLGPDGSLRQVYEPGAMGDPLTLIHVIRGCFFGVGAVYRRETFDLVGGYRLGTYGEDYDFWLRAMARGARHCYVPLPLAIHRLGAAQKSSDTEKVLRSDIAILRDLEGSGMLTRRECAAAHDSVCGRLAQMARLDPRPATRAVRVVATYLARPASLLRALMRRARRHVRIERRTQER